MADMTKRQLIQALQDDPSDMDSPVRLMYNYGDRGNNIVAAKIVQIEEVAVRHSEYHRSDIMTEDASDNTQFVTGLFSSYL